MNKPLKIACYGLVEKSVGSVAGANFLILEELLQRGFEIDFFGWPGFTEPKELFEYKNFKYISLVIRSRKGNIVNAFPKTVRPFLKKLLDPDRPLVKFEILKHHENRRYDLLLYLGTNCPYQIAELPVVSWVQGPPRTEWRYIHKNRRNLFKVGAFGFYLTAFIYYTYKDLVRIKKELRCSDTIICGSKWSINQFVEFGIEQKKLFALPYPIDTNLFNINLVKNERVFDKKTFLWLGRIDTRKRFDLLLDAYRLLLQERKDVFLKIFGGFTHDGKYKKLLEQFEFPEYLEYQPFIERSKVPSLLVQCDILIQPSEAENFGSSVAEALCCGLPVIIGETNGTKDYVGSASFEFEDYEPESLKVVMLKVIHAIEKDANFLREEARKTAENNFNISIIVDKLESIFHKTINNFLPSLRSEDLPK